MPGSYGTSLFEDDEDWNYDVDWDALELPPDIDYGLDDYIREMELEQEMEEAINKMLRDAINDHSS